MRDALVRGRSPAASRGLVPDDAITGPSGGALGTLRPMAAIAGTIMAGFFFYNFVDVAPDLRDAMLLLDGLCVIVCATVWWMIGAGRIPESRAHAAAVVMIVLIASNILVSIWLTKITYNAIYISVLLIGAGAGMSSPRWGVATFAALWAMSVPVLLAELDTATAVRYMATMAACTGVAGGLLTLRVRNLRALARLAAIDRRQRDALQDALDDLDAKVAQRTAELQAANDALQAQIVERARAEEEARRLSEQLLHAQRLESLGRLAGGVAHDFNNLLTVIEGNLRLIMGELPPGADRESLEDAIGASERAGQLTKQLLAFGRKQVIERTVFDVGRLLDDSTRILQRVLGESITLDVTADERDLLIDADANQIQQVLMNLTVNARDAMPNGGQLRISAEHVRLRDARYVRVRVRDSGVGMDAETRERLFEPFFTTKAPGLGTGLGLSTVYGVVQQHGGHIEVQSLPREGTTFDVFLPASTRARKVSSGEHIATVAATGNETVLLVEDEDAVRRVAERFLRRAGYEVLVASGGAEAIGIAGTLGRPIDLLFTDVMMPGMNGRELAERLRAAQPALKVLFVSGYSGDYLQTQTGELPAGTHFLYKPYEPSRAAVLIRDILDGRAADPRD